MKDELSDESRFWPSLIANDSAKDVPMLQNGRNFTTSLFTLSDLVSSDRCFAIKSKQVPMKRRLEDLTSLPPYSKCVSCTRSARLKLQGQELEYSSAMRFQHSPPSHGC
jgi:hypothetical protein